MLDILRGVGVEAQVEPTGDELAQSMGRTGVTQGDVTHANPIGPLRAALWQALLDPQRCVPSRNINTDEGGTLEMNGGSLASTESKEVTDGVVKS